MPESRTRKNKNPYTPPSTKPEPVKFGNAAWWAPTMVAFFVLGLAWIVVYYISQPNGYPVPALGWWNIVVGFGLIGVGFGMSTRWT